MSQSQYSKSRTLSPGRALRPEVRMNKEQEEAVKLTCESWEAFPDGSEKTCGKPAKIHLNGFPCCEECFVEFEANDLIESWEWLSGDDPSPDTIGAMVRAQK